MVSRDIGETLPNSFYRAQIMKHIVARQKNRIEINRERRSFEII